MNLLTAVTVITLGFGAAAANGQEVHTYEVAGRVVDSQSGEGIPNARVSARVQLFGPNLSTVEFVLHTGNDGEFGFRNLPKSSLEIWADKAGYIGGSWSPPFKEQQAKAQMMLSEGSPPSPAALKQVTKRLTLKLIRQAVIEGIAKDAKGSSVASVRLFRQTETGEVASFRDMEVDRTGEFRFAPLLPGRYFLGVGTASPSGRSGQEPPLYQRSFHGDAPDLKSAKAIDLVAGQIESIAMELQPAKGFEVRGRVAGSSDFPAFMLKEVGTMQTIGSALWDSQTQTFTISNVPAGTYVLEVNWSVGNKALHAAVPVTITGSSVDGLLVTPLPDKN